MSYFMFFLAVSAGTMAAAITNPIIWVLMALCFCLGWSRSSVIYCVGLSCLFGGLVVYANWDFWREAGLSIDSSRMLRIFLPRLVLGLMAFGIGVLAARLLRKKPRIAHKPELSSQEFNQLILPLCIDISDNWIQFTSTFAFKDDVTLSKQIELFAEPMLIGLFRRHPDVMDRMPRDTYPRLLNLGLMSTGEFDPNTLEAAITNIDWATFDKKFT